MKTKEIFSKRIATELRQKGFKIVANGINPKNPMFDTYIFILTDELQTELDRIMES